MAFPQASSKPLPLDPPAFERPEQHPTALWRTPTQQKDTFARKDTNADNNPLFLGPPTISEMNYRSGKIKAPPPTDDKKRIITETAPGGLGPNQPMPSTTRAPPHRETTRENMRKNAPPKPEAPPDNFMPGTMSEMRHRTTTKQKAPPTAARQKPEAPPDNLMPGTLSEMRHRTRQMTGSPPPTSGKGSSSTDLPRVARTYTEKKSSSEQDKSSDKVPEAAAAPDTRSYSPPGRIPDAQSQRPRIPGVTVETEKKPTVTTPAFTKEPRLPDAPPVSESVMAHRRAVMSAVNKDANYRDIAQPSLTDSSLKPDEPAPAMKPETRHHSGSTAAGKDHIPEGYSSLSADNSSGENRGPSETKSDTSYRALSKDKDENGLGPKSVTDSQLDTDTPAMDSKLSSQGSTDATAATETTTGMPGAADRTLGSDSAESAPLASERSEMKADESRRALSDDRDDPSPGQEPLRGSPLQDDVPDVADIPQRASGSTTPNKRTSSKAVPRPVSESLLPNDVPAVTSESENKTSKKSMSSNAVPKPVSESLLPNDVAGISEAEIEPKVPHSSKKVGDAKKADSSQVPKPASESLLPNDAPALKSESHRDMSSERKGVPVTTESKPTVSSNVPKPASANLLPNDATAMKPESHRKVSSTLKDGPPTTESKATESSNVAGPSTANLVPNDARALESESHRHMSSAPKDGPAITEPKSTKSREAAMPASANLLPNDAPALESESHQNKAVKQKELPATKSESTNTRDAPASTNLLPNDVPAMESESHRDKTVAPKEKGNVEPET